MTRGVNTPFQLMPLENLAAVYSEAPSGYIVPKRLVDLCLLRIDGGQLLPMQGS